MSAPSFKESHDRSNYYTPSFKELCERFNYTPTGETTVDTKHVAKMIGWQPNTLEIDRTKHQTKRKGPPFIRVGRNIRYVEYDVLKWLALRCSDAIAV